MAEQSERYEPGVIEPKWQAKWREADLFHTTEDPSRPKIYGLEFYPYPSGAGLSVGHLRNYVPTDVFCRMKRMQGFNVLHPMGWDAFGQPAETEAIKKNSHPKNTVPAYIATYKRQMNLLGIGYDWSREINSSAPDYYRWTQWIFLLLYKRGLAYRKFAPVNWCPTCHTVLANEEVQGGLCWRCGNPVEKKQLHQWFFKITEYAQRLLDDLEGLDWSEGIKAMQRNWIGRSEGVEFEMEIDGIGEKFRAFTTRIDTIYGVTFCVFAPEHPLVEKMTTADQKPAVEAYVAQTQRESEMDRMSTERERTGVFTGAYAINPVTGERVPIWVADYVLMGYGTGAIMAVPGHDERDFDFAKKYGLEIRRVVADRLEDADRPVEQAETAYGFMVNSGEYTGMPFEEGSRRLAEWFEARGTGVRKVNFRLRDWLISRQRYWGAPIPIIHCDKCGEVPVPEEGLPVLLPDVENYLPTGTGESPLAAIDDFVNVNCPKCGGPAKRETDTMGGFACSSWYFLRFADPHNDKRAFDPEKVEYWLPVDCYVGGAEHAVMHLLYARFWTKVLHDAGLLTFVEPFTRLINQGMLLAATPYRKPRQGEKLSVGEEGILVTLAEAKGMPESDVSWKWEKMSKSKGNVITPEEVVEKHGADALRVYELFVAPFDQPFQWSEEGMQGAQRFLSRAWRTLLDIRPSFRSDWRTHLATATSPAAKKLRQKTHQTVAKVTDDVDGFRFNTAVAAMMEWLNAMVDSQQAIGASTSRADAEDVEAGKARVSASCTDAEDVEAGEKLVTLSSSKGDSGHAVALSEAAETFLRVLSPMAPHIADELWERYGFEGFLFTADFPVSDPAVAKVDEVTIALQVNGKLRGTLVAPAEAGKEELERLALENPKVQEHLTGLTVRKVIVVPGRLVNVVTRP